jgi:hypothetical protein
MPVLKSEFVDEPFRLIIDAGATLATVVHFETIDSSDTVTGDYDFSDWDDTFWCGITGGTEVDAPTNEPIADLTVTKHDAAGGKLLFQLSSKDTRAVQSRSILHGWGDVFGRLNGEVLKVSDIVWQLNQNTTDTQPLDGSEVSDPPEAAGG